MAKSSVIVVAIVVCVLVVAPHAHCITCDSVITKLQPCSTALQGKPVTEKCCSGMRSLKSAANTPAARKSACECIKKLSKSYKVKSQTANALVKKCNVNIGYPISYNVDCNKVR